MGFGPCGKAQNLTPSNPLARLASEFCPEPAFSSDYGKAELFATIRIHAT